MIIVIDAVNAHRFGHLMDEMFRLRKRVFADRLGWDVVCTDDGREIDAFDRQDPAYILGLDDAGNVVSCVRALQTTGPHMLSEVFTDILDGEPPLRAATIWESTRFCVDTERLGRGKARNSVSYATCELMIGALEYAMRSGISDIVTVIDPVMDRVLKRSDCAPYDYVGKRTPMGKVPALAALLDCTTERVDRVRAFAGIHHDVRLSDDAALDLAPPTDAPATTAAWGAASGVSIVARNTDPIVPTVTPGKTALRDYCREQIKGARTPKELDDALALTELLLGDDSREPESLDRAAG